MRILVNNMPFEDQIRRNDLPADVFGILHDLCYAYPRMSEWKLNNMIDRARAALLRGDSGQ